MTMPYPADAIQMSSLLQPQLEGLANRLRQWAPEAIVCAAVAGTQYPIPPEDRRYVTIAVVRRQAEFIAGRWCAHQALDQLGIPAQTLPVGHMGQPIWPNDVVGSITHEAERCLALAMHRRYAAGVGIDLASVARGRPLLEARDLIIAPGEDIGEVALDRVFYILRLFSAKEAVVKAVSARMGRFLDLREIRVDFVQGTFQALVESLASPVLGRWDVQGDAVLSYARLDPPNV